MEACLAIYDVRGIQNYIFKTDALKEIIGASNIVDDFLIEEFKNACFIEYGIDNLNNDGEVIKTDWCHLFGQEPKPFTFDNDKVMVEILYFGGGNLVAAFKDQQACTRINQSIAKAVIRKYYGLSIAFASVEKTDNFERDYSNLRKELDRVKLQMPITSPAGNLSITLNDPISGYPLSMMINDNRGKNKITKEASAKLKRSKKDNKTTINEVNYTFASVIDDMRTNNEEGLVAIVHIDGNSMGINIKNSMKGKQNYQEAVAIMRKLSVNIQSSFVDETLGYIESNIPDYCKKHGVKINKNILPYRRIIAAGDDITFVCNARISLDITKDFLKKIGDYSMLDGLDPFSACAGISIIHAHFPFAKGYIVAEECCDSAKKRAKNEGLENNKVGNFIDFQYCYSGVLNSLDEMRDKHYYNLDNYYLLKRPYGVYKDNPNSNYDIETNFINPMKKLSSISRSWSKRMRDTYYESETDLLHVVQLYKSRNLDFSLGDLFKDGIAQYYDVLEFMDLYGGKK